MAIGPKIRRLFGPYEQAISEAYRSIYIDLDAWARQMREWIPHAPRILEAGCGEGALTNRLVSLFPEAQLTAIDISPRLGRLFCGDKSRVTFMRVDAADLARSEPSSFDLAVMSDVLHHVPPAERLALLAAVRDLLKVGGHFAFKDWAPSRTLVHWMCLAADRYLTGDHVIFPTKIEAATLLERVFGSDALIATMVVPPRPNNIAFLVLR
jgi:SAM-dependent methyltransferase